jgi:hypothetical protein
MIRIISACLYAAMAGAVGCPADAPIQQMHRQEGAPPVHPISSTQPLGFSARVATGGKQGSPLHPTVRILNEGLSTATVSYNPCSFGLRMYPLEQIDGYPLWDSMREIDCTDVMLHLHVPPRSYQDLPVLVPVDDILGDSIQPGTYDFAVTVQPEVPGEVQEVPAGRALVRRR